MGVRLSPLPRNRVYLERPSLYTRFSIDWRIMITDLTGRFIALGDVVLYTAPGAGRNLPPLRAGRVLKMTKHSITVQRLKSDLRSEKMRDVGYYRETGEAYKWGGMKKEFVKTGEEPKEPENVKFYKDRFYILDTI